MHHQLKPMVSRVNLAYGGGNTDKLGDNNNESICFAVGEKLAKLLLKQEAIPFSNATSVNGQPPYSIVMNFANYSKQQYAVDKIMFVGPPPKSSNAINSCAVNNGDCEDFNYELAAAFLPRKPPASYICHSCNLPGHYIKYCPKRPEQQLTSYLGNKRSVGVFVCSKCKHEWTSTNSHSQEGQKCNKCGVLVFPKKQYSVEKAFEFGILTCAGRRRNGSLCTSGTSTSFEELSPSVSPFMPGTGY